MIDVNKELGIVRYGMPCTIKNISDGTFRAKKAGGKEGSPYFRASIEYTNTDGSKRTVTAMLYENYQTVVGLEKEDTATAWVLLEPVEFQGLTTIGGGGRIDLDAIGATAAYAEWKANQESSDSNPALELKVETEG